MKNAESLEAVHTHTHTHTHTSKFIENKEGRNTFINGMKKTDISMKVEE